jgi:uncharacterized paraquat-inducible protein A
MLRNPNDSWLRRVFGTQLVPAYIRQDADAARRCPECSAAYDTRDRYCPRCHTATPEWRYG